jgi:PST family polysaccharide transporter
LGAAPDLTRLRSDAPAMSDGLKAQTVRGVGWSTVQNWSRQLITFVVYWVLARILGPESYGLIAMAGVFITVLNIFSDVSFGAALEQRQELTPQHINAVFWAFLGLGAVLTAIGITGAPLVAEFFDEPDLPPVIRWLSVGFFLQMICGVQTSLLRRDLRIKELTRQTLYSTIAGSTVGVTLAYLGAGVWALVAQRLVTRSVSVVMLWRLSTWRPQREFSWIHFRDVAGFGFSVMGNRVLSYLNQRLDQLLIGRFLDTIALGLYYNAHRIMTLFTGLLIGSYSQIAMPAFAKLQDDPKRFQAAFNKACRFITLVAFPAFTLLAILGDDLIILFLGEKWSASAPVLQVLSMAGIVLAIQYVNGAAMMAWGRADLRLILLAIHGLGNTIGFLIAVRYGIVWVAAAYTIRAYLFAPLDTLLNRRIGAVSVSGLVRAIRTQAMATLVMAASLWLLKQGLLADWSRLPRLLVCGILGIALYATIALVLDRKLWAEILDLVRHVRPDHKRQPE